MKPEKRYGILYGLPWYCICRVCANACHFCRVNSLSLITLQICEKTYCTQTPSKKKVVKKVGGVQAKVGSPDPPPFPIGGCALASKNTQSVLASGLGLVTLGRCGCNHSHGGATPLNVRRRTA
jgi:hypothetical protein